MNEEEEIEKIEKLFEYQEDITLRTVNVMGYAAFLWLNSCLGILDFSMAMDNQSTQDVIMYGMLGAVNVGFCTFEVNKIVDNLKLRKESIKKFDTVLAELDANERRKTIKR